MKNMVFIYLCAALLFLPSCVSQAEEQTNSNGYLPMPEKYLGYWAPVSKTLAGVGIDIQPGVILHKDDAEYYADDPEYTPDFIRYKEWYKVFYIEDNPDKKDDSQVTQYVYAIIKHQITPEWAHKTIRPIESFPPEEHKKRQEIMDSILQPNYKYYRFSINKAPYRVSDWFNIHIGDRDCALTAKDWDLPAYIHRQRILDNYCDTVTDPRTDLFGYGATWNRPAEGTKP